MMGPMMGTPMPMMVPMQSSYLSMQNPGMMPGGQVMAQPTIQQPQQQILAPQTASRDLNWIKANQNSLGQMNPKDVENIFGTLLYPKILPVVSNSEMCAKITGMLIEPGVLEYGELIELLENPQTLRSRIKEATDIITDSQK